MQDCCDKLTLEISGAVYHVRFIDGMVKEVADQEFTEFLANCFSSLKTITPSYPVIKSTRKFNTRSPSVLVRNHIPD